jgi:hypothetical protein
MIRKPPPVIQLGSHAASQVATIYAYDSSVQDLCLLR